MRESITKGKCLGNSREGDDADMTFHELKMMVNEAPIEEKMPTARQLQESRTKIVAEEMFGDEMLTVYINGYVDYERICQDVSYATVFRLHSCGNYYYSSVKDFGGDNLPEDIFENETWYIRLLIEGNDRLQDNCDRVGRRRERRYFSSEEDCSSDLGCRYMEPLDMYLKSEDERLYLKCLSCMTERQQEIIEYYYRDGLRMEDIAEIYHVSRQCVSRILRDGIWNARAEYGIKKRQIPRGVYNKRK
ncbi:MAG: hypothetical protein LUD18_03865 [Lachnospiraceae bacterium]|nr:hypothetical protein [Lachnospiraceae bacterium]